jgi:hypothetical protein
MSSDAKSKIGGGSGGFKSRMEHYLYSGDKKHVMAGIAVISVIFAVPWYFMSRGFDYFSLSLFYYHCVSILPLFGSSENCYFSILY